MALRYLSIAGLLALGTLGACAPAGEEDLGDDSTVETGEDEVRAGTVVPVYYRVRADNLRRCASPFCGGYWVSRINRSTTRCVDGSYAPECYVAEMDWTALGLGEEVLAEFQTQLLNNHGLIRGRMEAKTFVGGAVLGQVVAMEAWQAASDTVSTSAVYTVRDNGIRCITTPCGSYNEVKANYSTEQTLVGVDLSRVAGVPEATLQTAYEQLSGDGILVAGRHYQSSGLGGSGRALRAGQFFVKLSPGVSDALYCMQDSECTPTYTDRVPASESECYCITCTRGVLNQRTAEAYSTAFHAMCDDVSLRCPAVRCMAPPPTACQNHTCVELPR